MPSADSGQPFGEQLPSLQSMIARKSMATRGQIGCIRWLGIDQHAGHEAGKANSHHKAKGKAGDA